MTCDPDNADLAISCRMFRQIYEKWCEGHGIKPRSDKRLGRAIKKYAPHCERRNLQRGGHRGYYHCGLALSRDSEYYQEAL